MRLIDADALPKYTGYALSADEVAMAVENAPTIDAVPVVRCKDCRWWTEWSNGGIGSCSRFALDWLGTDADDFCSFAERKDDE